MSHTVCLPLPHLSLADTLDCGQAFRFTPLPEGGFSGVVGNRPCEMQMQGDHLQITCHCLSQSCQPFWEDYFDLSRDYSALQQRLSTEPSLKAAVAFAPGLRVLRQEPFEALCTFILSQNNSIPNIKGIVARLCGALGQPLPGEVFGFPTPEVLAGETLASLAPLRAGYRAGYLLDAAEKVASGVIDLPALGLLPLEEARMALMRIRGVGPKVADCMLLYGLHRVESLPKDVWINRVLEALYPGGFPVALSDVAGLAQQYLFHYARHCPEALAISPEPQRSAPAPKSRCKVPN